MGNTKTVAGKSKKVTITAVSQSIADLISEAIDDSTRRVQISFIGSITGVAPVAWITEDESHTLTSGDGSAIYAGAVITVTKDNFPHFRIVKNSGGDFQMWLKQLAHEQQRL